ncbi:MAG: phosphate ABC transporter permease PstA [Gammaproteobacteria bacterium]|nr:phosphate ABC transporter permease PstA [Gammaproteobacteria bacterium]
MILILMVFSVMSVIPLLAIFLYVLSRGGAALNLDFFTHLPQPVGEGGGGMGNAVIGSLSVLGLASLIGIPIGIANGILLSEYRLTPLAQSLRLSTDLLTSVPSIIVGLFVYAIIVRPMRGFSGYAGAVALAIIMIPTIARTTEEVLKLIPQHIREAGLALGLPRWKVTTHIVLQCGLSGILTGTLLSLARIAGETAPLLFTSFGNPFWPSSLSDPTPTLPVQIYTYAISPFTEWQEQAWVGALVLISFVFGLNIITRCLFHKKISL